MSQLSRDGRHLWDAETGLWVPVEDAESVPAPARRITPKSVRSVLVLCVLLVVIGVICALGLQACAREMAQMNPFSMGVLPLVGRS